MQNLRGSKNHGYVDCPLCLFNKPYFKSMIDFAIIRKNYKNSFGIEIGEPLVNKIYIYECPRCDLIFFTPSVLGDASFYQKLAKNDWYYMDNKWEFDQAAKDILPFDRVLEVGCGSGSFLERLKNQGVKEIIGIDLNETALREAKKKGLRVLKTTIEELAKYENQTFDVICSFQVLEHVANPRSFLNASIKLLKTKGRLIIAVPNSKGFLSEIRFPLLDMPPHHITRWSIKTFLYLEKFLPLKIERYNFEPIAKYHKTWYTRNKLLNEIEKIIGKEMTDSFDKFVIIRKLISGFSNYIFLPFLTLTGNLSKINGHTLYVKYRKIN